MPHAVGELGLGEFGGEPSGPDAAGDPCGELVIGGQFVCGFLRHF